MEAIDLQAEIARPFTGGPMDRAPQRENRIMMAVMQLHPGEQIRTFPGLAIAACAVLPDGDSRVDVLRHRFERGIHADGTLYVSSVGLWDKMMGIARKHMAEGDDAATAAIKLNRLYDMWNGG